MRARRTSSTRVADRAATSQRPHGNTIRMWRRPSRFQPMSPRTSLERNRRAGCRCRPGKAWPGEKIYGRNRDHGGEMAGSERHPSTRSRNIRSVARSSSTLPARMSAAARASVGSVPATPASGGMSSRATQATGTGIRTGTRPRVPQAQSKHVARIASDAPPLPRRSVTTRSSLDESSLVKATVLSHGRGWPTRSCSGCATSPSRCEVSR